MTEKPKETPKEELECPKKYVYDTGIIFECKDNSRVEIIGEDVVGLLNELATKCSKLEKENEQLRQVMGFMQNDNTNDILNVLNSQEDMLKQLRNENEQLKKELFEARKDYLIETADISDKLHIEEWIEKERKEILK